MARPRPEFPMAVRKPLITILGVLPVGGLSLTSCTPAPVLSMAVTLLTVMLPSDDTYNPALPLLLKLFVPLMVTADVTVPRMLLATLAPNRPLPTAFK